jgi:small-conductance mechanosensitive channel
MYTITQFLQKAEGIVFLENNLKQIVIAGVVFLGLVFFFKIIFWATIKRLEKLATKTTTNIDDFIIELINSIRPPAYYLAALYFATLSLNLPKIGSKIIFGIFVIVIILQIVSVALKVVDYVIDLQIKKAGKEDKSRKTILSFLKQILKGLLWVVGILTILSNLGVNVTSLVAGLGIGGLALAMASKNILADIFSSFSILIDKPFVVGDFIGLNAREQGTVKKIGIKTTRLETKEGQELIVANKKLTDQVVQNFNKKDKNKRNITFVLGVTYETSNDKLKRIPEIIKEVIDKQPDAKLTRAVFDNFGDFALNFKVSISSDKTDHHKLKQIRNDINYAIFEAFLKEEIDFAYPTQTIQIAK